MTRHILLVDIGNALMLSGVLPSATLNGAYSAQLSARGGRAPYTYTVSAGALPAGLYLDPATGIVAGTASAAGAFALTVRATDTSGRSVQRSYVIAVIGEPLVLTLTGTFAAAAVGTPYSSDLTITNGDAPYALHSGTGVISGALPDGLVLSIVGTKLRLSGTPTTEATSAFTVAVDSSDGQMAASAQSVAIAPDKLTARYWRIYVTALVDETYLAIQELELRGTPGGSDVTHPSMDCEQRSYFTSPSNFAFLGSLAINNDFTTVSDGGPYIANNSGMPQWLTVDLGSPMRIAEVAIWPHNSLDPTFGVGPNRAPKDFVIQNSNDKITWVDVKNCVGITGWVIGPANPKVFTL